eukprot:g3482.t1
MGQSTGCIALGNLQAEMKWLYPSELQIFMFPLAEWRQLASRPWKPLAVPRYLMPKRRETEATRRRRAQLAKYRQGPNGKWESNAKKAVAIRVKRQSLRIGPLLASCKAKKVALEARNFQAALRLVKERWKMRDFVVDSRSSKEWICSPRRVDRI